MMIGRKQVEDCLGIARATIYRALKAGQMKHPIKIGGTNRWPKAYIEQVMQSGFEPDGTYPPFNEPQAVTEKLSTKTRRAEAVA